MAPWWRHHLTQRRKMEIYMYIYKITAEISLKQEGGKKEGERGRARYGYRQPQFSSYRLNRTKRHRLYTFFSRYWVIFFPAISCIPFLSCCCLLINFTPSTVWQKERGATPCTHQWRSHLWKMHAYTRSLREICPTTKRFYVGLNPSFFRYL